MDILLIKFSGKSVRKKVNWIFKVFAMYQDFRVKDRWTGEELHCIYQAIIVAISTRHADAVST